MEDRTKPKQTGIEEPASAHRRLTKLEKSESERERAEEELKKYKDHLEELVEERTRELKLANEQLEREIAERSRAEDLLRKERETFSSILENNPGGVALIHENGEYQYTNPEFTAITGYTLEDVPNGRDWMKKAYPDPEYRKRVIESWKNDRSPEGKSTDVAFTIRCKDGRLKDIEFRITHLRDRSIVVLNDVTDRKEAEKALKESEAKYHSIFENAVEGIFQSTPEGRFLSVNPAFARMCGYSSPEEMIESITDIASQHYVNPEKRKEFKERLDDAGFVENYEHQIYRKDGGTLWVSINARAVKDEQGKTLYYEGTHENITDHKLAEERVRESEKRLSDIIQFFPDPTLVVDDEGRVTSWNLAMEELTGVKAEEMLGKGDHEYALPFYGERRPILIDLVKEAAEETEKQYAGIERHGNILSGEAFMPSLRAGEVCLYGTATVLRDSAGKIVGAIESIRDITERKQTEMKLLESEERYRTAIEHSNDGVALVKGGQQVYVNQRFLEMFGYDNPDETGGDIYGVVHPDDRETVREYNRKRQRGEPAPSRYEFKGVRKDGSTVFVEASVAATVDRGEPASLAYLRDVTERKHTEERLRTMSIVDELTGLYNRRGFFALSQQQLKLAERKLKDMMLFFIDLDGMKGINDTLGHHEGDTALATVAALLRHTFRKSDIIGRMGGDEFAVLAIDTADDAGEVLTRRLREFLDEINGLETRKYALSVSVGVAHYDPGNPSSLDELIAAADTLMYEDKGSKRRRS